MRQRRLIWNVARLVQNRLLVGFWLRLLKGLTAVFSEQPPPDHLRILSKVHDRRDDDSCRLHLIENPIRELPGEHAPIGARIHWSHLRMLAQQSKRGVQLAHENLASP